MHGKLHRVQVTQANRNYVGSITVDRELLDAVGLLPLEEVDIVNVSNGKRWRTYLLPGPAGQGDICPNGGGALLCTPGDLLILWANVHRPHAEVLAGGHSARVAIIERPNRIAKLVTQTLGWDEQCNFSFSDGGINNQPVLACD